MKVALHFWPTSNPDADWVRILPRPQYIVNNLPNSSTDLSADEFIYGRDTLSSFAADDTDELNWACLPLEKVANFPMNQLLDEGLNSPSSHRNQPSLQLSTTNTFCYWWTCTGPRCGLEVFVIQSFIHSVTRSSNRYGDDPKRCCFALVRVTEKKISFISKLFPTWLNAGEQKLLVPLKSSIPNNSSFYLRMTSAQDNYDLWVVDDAKSRTYTGFNYTWAQETRFGRKLVQRPIWRSTKVYWCAKCWDLPGD